jgi:hypothetical protein
MSEISTATRQELVQAVGERYRTVSADDKVPSHSRDHASNRLFLHLMLERA